MLFEGPNCVRYFEQKIGLGRGSVNASDGVRFHCGSGHPGGAVAGPPDDDVLATRQGLKTSGSVISVNTAGEGSVLIVLEADGSLRGYDIATGKQVTRTKPLITGAPDVGADGGAAPVVEVDRSRAYLNDPKGKRVHEIDYNDNLHVARTFDLDIAPSLTMETG